MPFGESKKIELVGPKISAIQGLLSLKGVFGSISSLTFNEHLGTYQVGVTGGDNKVSYHTIAVSQVAEVTRPRLGV